MNVSRSLFRSFAILLALLLFLIGFSIFNFRRLSDADAWKTHTYTVLQQSHRFYRSVQDVDSAIRSLVLAESDERALYYAAVEKSEAELKTLQALTEDNAAQSARLRTIENLKKRWVSENLEPILEMKSRTPNLAQALLASGQLAPGRRAGLNRVSSAIDDFERTEEEFLRERSDDQEQWQRLTQITLWIGSIFSVLLTATLALFAARSTRQLDKANVRLQHFNAELESSNAQLAQTNEKIAREVMQRRAAELRLQSAVSELERSNKELEEFAYVASHDLQEPLRAVAGCVQVLKKRYSGQLDARADQFIEHAVEGSQRMQNLINDLLAYSRVGTRGKPFEKASGETILNHALRNLSTQIAETGVAIERAPMPELLCDPGQLEQVFQNLISNAIKFRGQTEPKVRIGYRTDAESSSAENPNDKKSSGENHIFSISDNGLGMEPQYFERIFVMFQRLHTRAEFAGTGIGLAICKKIVERHGGKIWVESEKGQGSTFFFSIPMQPAPEPEV